MYKKDFDCPPGNGIPCTSVSKLESMIVETQCGEDTFLGCTPKLVEMQVDPICECSISNSPESLFQRRIWINSKDCESPIYIYFKENLACEEQ